MPNLKLNYTPAPGIDKPPDKRYNNQTFWANAGEDIKHPGKTDISTQLWMPQHIYDWDSNLSLSENLLANQDSTNIPIEYQYGDYFNFRGCSSLVDNFNECVGQCTTNCFPHYGGGDQGSAMGLWGEDMTTSQNYIDCTQDLFKESIAGDIQAQNCTDIPVSSITCISAALGFQKMPPNTIPHPIMADSVACDPCTPSFKRLPDSFLVEVGVTANLVPDVNDIRGSSAGIKSTALTTPRQKLGQCEQINELWRDRNYIEKVVYSVGKLGDQLQGWNKHQKDAVQETLKRQLGTGVENREV
ncbi:hypothetical protein V2G26_007280 [Clonostachys chloroleuca]